MRRFLQRELDLQVLFFYAWQEDTNLVRKAAMVPLYFTLLIPMRFWNHFPYPTLIAMILTGIPLAYSNLYPGYISETQFMLYYAVLLGPLYEAFVLNAVYYWVPGGKESLSNFFYGKEHITTFFGNPISNMRAGFGVFATLGTYELIKTVEFLRETWQKLREAQTAVEIAHSTAEAARTTAEAARTVSDQAEVSTTKAMAGTQAEIKTLRDNGVEVSPEEVRSIMSKYNKLHNVAGEPESLGTNISGNVHVSDESFQTGVKISHRSDGITINGEGNVNRSLGDIKKAAGLPSTGFASPKKD